MKTKIDNTELPASWPKFPCLGISNMGAIVLFSSKWMGVVLESPDNRYEVGSFSNNWNIEAFKPFNKKITLWNE